ncbi:YfhO family protein, partial [Enterococcus faecalis]|nr:YfhO family protein [Enterococcus faecalis]
VRILFPNQEKVTFSDFQVLALDIDQFQKASDELIQQTLSTTVSKNQIETSYTAPQETSLLYTLPFDVGWTATVNGQKTIIEPFQNGLIKIKVAKGQGKVVLTFIPKGLREGVIAFLAGIVGFFLYDLTKKKWSRHS